jgi:glycosyltransferase 2 family protein
MKESSPPDDEGGEAPAADRRRRRRQLLHLAASVAILAATAYFVDAKAVVARLRDLHPGWLVVGLAISLPMYALLAARWWFTARRVEARLTYGRALSDYYLSTFLNQTLPLGVAGDALRAIRHARRLRAGGDERGLGRAVRTLLVERLAGLAVLGIVVALAGATLIGEDRRVAALGLGEALAIGVAVGLVAVAGRRRIAGAAVAELGKDARRALFARGAFPAQLVLASGALAAMIATFYCSARATGLALDPLAVAQVAPIILAATTLPLAFAGWGVREAVTAAIWGALGLEPAAGAAVAVTFGLLSLVASVPGLAVWLVPHE